MNDGEDRLIGVEALQHDTVERADTALRPERLADFIGQGGGRANLETFIAAARDRGDGRVVQARSMGESSDWAEDGSASAEDSTSHGLAAAPYRVSGVRPGRAWSAAPRGSSPLPSC